MTCLGFLIVFHCALPQPVAVSEFCRVAKSDIQKMRNYSTAELAALTRSHKEANLSLRLKFKRLC